MPEKNDAITQPFVEFWSSYLQQANATTKAMLESFNGSADPGQWRDRWLAALSESLDAYMRSPAFLQAMKHNMDAVIEAKTQLDDVQKEVARNAGIPTVSDISGLFERIHSVEDSIISRLEKIEQKLGTIESRLSPPGGDDKSYGG